MKLGLKITGQSGVMRQLLDLEQSLGSADKVLRTGVSDLFAQVSERVQQNGRGTDGALIGGGVYSKGHARARRKQGRQTSYIDLTLSGDLLDRGFIVGPAPAGGWGLGWANTLSADKAGWLEDYFGDIFKPSKAEKDQAFGYILQDIRNEIRKRNRRG
jgi:hypothetical protein